MELREAHIDQKDMVRFVWVIFAVSCFLQYICLILIVIQLDIQDDSYGIGMTKYLKSFNIRDHVIVRSSESLQTDLFTLTVSVHCWHSSIFSVGLYF